MSAMHKLAWLGLLAGIWLFLPATVPAAEMMKPGLWEITTSMEMPDALPGATADHAPLLHGAGGQGGTGAQG